MSFRKNLVLKTKRIGIIMKLREVVRAIEGFQYEVNEYDVFPTGKIQTRTLFLKIDETNIRCKNHNMHHEKLVKGGWFIVTPEEFNQEINFQKKNKVIVRKKTGTVEVKNKVQLSLIDSMILTNHFRDRAQERFGKTNENINQFIDLVLKDHFIVQNYHLWTGNYSQNKAHSIAICSRDFKYVFICEAKDRKYVLITCYDPMNSEYPAFNSWFQSNMNKIHEMPSLRDYFKE